MKGFSKEEVTNRGQFKGRPERLVVGSRLENPRLCFFLVQHLGFVAAKTNRLSHFPALFFFLGRGPGVVNYAILQPPWHLGCCWVGLSDFGWMNTPIFSFLPQTVQLQNIPSYTFNCTPRSLPVH